MDDCLSVINQELLSSTAHAIPLFNIISKLVMVDPMGSYYSPSMLTLDCIMTFHLSSFFKKTNKQF